ncbi:MAG: anthranilate synthase component I, partial [Deltaproteobacteria bacterium]|nr:anthranilate synthase component I [Deltaproteobacteria bacterium]
MTETRFVTKGGLRATRQETRLPAVSALDDVWSAIDRRKGGLLVSNYEVPNRYARWDIGFINPPLELTAKGRRFYLRALNPEGEGLLPALAPALADHPHLAAFHVEKDCLHGEVIPAPRFFPEEERSRQPSFFSVLRALLDHLAGDQGELGFYGAFGFDLVFQFETLEQRMARHPDQVDCCLYFPTELVVVDRQKETATRIRFQFQTDEGGIGPAGGGKDQPAPPVLPPAPMASDHLPGEFEKKVDLVREGCRKGDYFEVV